MCWYKILLKNIAVGYLGFIDLILRIVRQISGQNNVSCKIQNHIGIFKSKAFVSVFQSQQKVIVEIFVLTRVLCVNRNFNNYAANRKFN